MIASKRQLMASASLGEAAANYRLGKAEKKMREMFDKMSDHCEFADKLSADPNIKDCLYHGRPAAHVCDGEICPILVKK